MSKYLTVSSADFLDDGNFELAVDLLKSQPRTNETVLVAPNKRMQKQWIKDYPGIKVVLQDDYTGYPLPTDATAYLGIQDKKEVKKHD